MITTTNIFVKYGDRVLLDYINLVVGVRDRMGLVGRNGAGKSTMLKIIAGDMLPDAGTVTRPNETTLGFLHQEMNLPKGKTVMEETLTAFGEAKRLEKRIETINVELTERTDYESKAYMGLLNELGDLNERFLILGGTSMQADAEKVLKGLGFKLTDFQRLTDEFSGGWQMRIELAKMLLSRPDYLLLDEPTNHLDIESIIWLEEFLQDYPGAVIVISHDKQFLDNVTKRTVEIELGKTYDYKSNYSKYVELRQERREKLASAYKNQQKVIAQKERLVERFKAKATKTALAQSIEKELKRMDRVEMDSEDVAAMNIYFPPARRSGEVVVEGKKVTKQYGNLLVLNEVDIKLHRGERIAFVGQNGQGKTTLAKIIVNQLPATRGDVNLGYNVEIGYYAQNQSETLDANKTLLETMEAASPPEMRTKLRSILGAFMFSGEDAEKKVMVLSGGERARLALACMLLRPFNLLVMDEPTNHLDMISKEVLKNALLEYDGSLIIVSHDRDFLENLTTHTIEFRDKQLFRHIGDVNAFLEKRALDNMRQVEMSTAQAKVAATNAKKEAKKIDFQERKRLQKAVGRAERKIEKLEADIEKIEALMAQGDFYERSDTTKKLEEYKKMKQDLDDVMEEWEEAQMELEEYLE